ncbi:protein THO1 homologue, putative [Candida dubliniensis CD36]|uniref:Protein THO1 homologue, putative n=1 Tax=Candida dubliniensis (strain CD36 / ATCC MYA-646 / CBS 7987 / NCPF 3949 / NRRL Y-17841) TaxID=573826 RepID=B9WCH9_CANDC|nr:protein THO1 homologue, putative [Candida dubliniensis CD36]CAX44101.1 protein THO1 homologue, putative [Candida dubliniensis CD36]
MSDYSSQTVAQLKEILKGKGLSIEGKKADLVQRLQEHEPQQQQQQQQQQQPEPEPEVTEQQQQQPETKLEENSQENESTLTVIQPKEQQEQEEEPKPKQLSPEERKQLAIELLTKKVQRAEKFGDEQAANDARKDLARVEKFGVEVGTALAREIGLVDNSLSNKKFNHHKRNNRRGFKGNKGRKGGFGKNRN